MELFWSAMAALSECASSSDLQLLALSLHQIIFSNCDLLPRLKGVSFVPAKPTGSALGFGDNLTLAVLGVEQTAGSSNDSAWEYSFIFRYHTWCTLYLVSSCVAHFDIVKVNCDVRLGFFLMAHGRDWMWSIRGLFNCSHAWQQTRSRSGKPTCF